MTNKELVQAFYEKVFNCWDISNIDAFMHDDYKQHNANILDGKDGFLKFCSLFFRKRPHMDIYHMMEDGDKVCVFVKCTLEDGTINKVFDMYRIRDGKLAEHWDCVEHNVEGINPINGNDLF